jgi:hypothetical protein
MGWPRIMLRVAIAVLAAAALISFFWLGYMPRQWEILLNPMTKYPISFEAALVNAVIAPLMALAAIVLAAMGRRLWIAVALLCAAFVFFYGMMIPFVIAIMIVGA